MLKTRPSTSIRLMVGSFNFCGTMEIKDSNPIELAEYARAQRLHEDPAFQWWVPSVSQQREAIVSKVKARAITSHKYGVEIPRTVQQAYSLDMKNGNLV